MSAPAGSTPWQLKLDGITGVTVTGMGEDEMPRGVGSAKIDDFDKPMAAAVAVRLADGAPVYTIGNENGQVPTYASRW
jgi:hypothetical protein